MLVITVEIPPHMHALLISPDHHEAQLIKRGLRYENIGCDVVRTLDDAYTKLLFTPFDSVMISGITMAQEQQNGALEKLCKVRQRMFIMVFGGDGKPIDCGNIAVFPKKFSIQEVAHRMKKFLYRRRIDPRQVIRFKDLKLNLLRREAWRKGRHILLRTKEFALLEYLMVNAGNVLTRPMILDHVWDRNTNIMTNTIDVHVASLRKKIDQHFESKRLKTIHGVGYKLA